MSTYSSLTELELQDIKETKEKQRIATVKNGDNFTLECGHNGRVVWVSTDLKSFMVKGEQRSCHHCGKNSKSSWSPTVYLYSPTEV